MKNKKILLFIAIILVIGAGIAFIFFKGNICLSIITTNKMKKLIIF